MLHQQKKYTFKNGKIILTEQQHHHDVPIAFPCSEDDIYELSQLSNDQETPSATVHALEQFNDDDFMKQYNTDANTNDVLPILTEKFTQQQIPIGLLPKLLELQRYAMHFVMDDSGSMKQNTDSMRNVASMYMKHKWNNQFNQAMTRWEEAEDRLHVMIDLLAYLPIQKVTISFLNRPDVLIFERHGLSPSELSEQMHRAVFVVFVIQPDGRTPMYQTLTRIFATTLYPTSFYIFTDGVPTDNTLDRVAQLIWNRKKRVQLKEFPVTFVSCSNRDDETEWMKDIESRGAYVAEVDDYEDEKREVVLKQSGIFPYTRGMWLCCLLVGVINPDDLDALDDRLPMSKYTLDNIFGRALSNTEYQDYWNNHPQRRRYGRHYKKFALSRQHTREIMEKIYPIQSFIKRKWNQFLIEII